MTQNVTDHERKMPLKDKISLGPIEKYTIYNRFPTKLTLHILLLILTSTIVSVSVQESQSQLRAQQYVWYKKFLLNADGEDVPVMDDFNREKRIFTVDDLKGFVNTSLTNYYAMASSNDEFENYKTPLDASLFVISMNSSEQSATESHLTPDVPDFGPIFSKSNQDFKAWLNGVEEFQINYEMIKIQYPPNTNGDYQCLLWNIT